LARDACVVAGPGSGKTTVLVERYRKLVESGFRAESNPGDHFHREGRGQQRERLQARFAEDPEKRRKLERAQCPPSTVSVRAC